MNLENIGYTPNNENYLTIQQVDNLEPFLMNIVSDGETWIFAGSNGTLTAGRGNPDQSLFPYETADKLLRFPLAAGSFTNIQVQTNSGLDLWEPWIDQSPHRSVNRNLHKHVDGSSICFEEYHRIHQLTFRWEWTTCDSYGFVRICTLKNESDNVIELDLLDGLNRILPAGVDQGLYEKASYLAEAYMRHEKITDHPMAIYTLNAPVSDRAEPSEQLSASFAGVLGLKPDSILISHRQIDSFRKARPIFDEKEERGTWGMFLTRKKLIIQPGEKIHWVNIADTKADHTRLVNLMAQFESNDELLNNVFQAVQNEQKGLRARIAMADGLQRTGDKTASDHHFSNVLYNCLRGGTFKNGYTCDRDDFIAFLKRNNRPVASLIEKQIDHLPAQFEITKINELKLDQVHPQMNRLIHQYLPITFSRRHGDPSRPWNRFDIRVRTEEGVPVYAYQGNWRDIFQNWESLAQSYPAFIINMRTLFLNATTADGYNPYRITSDGIDWELPDPSDPWSNIGYWGDHQIIYLLRLLETEEHYFPGNLVESLNDQVHSYANVPYEIQGYEAISQNPRSTIHFNKELNDRLEKQYEDIGADGKLISDKNGEILLGTLGEKLFIPLLTKLSNLIPGGGIWLNTQRPEWNDANNALAGYGLSMVTVCYIRRYLHFIQKLISQSDEGTHLEMHEATADFINQLTALFKIYDPNEAATSAKSRAQISESLGRTGEAHRNRIYTQDFGAIIKVSKTDIEDFIAHALKHIDASISVNQRHDEMMHSYNLITIDGDQILIKHLGLMLEGQVALLSSNWLDGKSAVTLCHQLRKSDLFREDQYSYLLYPDQSILSFTERNTLDAELLSEAPLLKELLERNLNKVVTQDRNQKLHFHPALTNANDLNHVLDQIEKDPKFADSVMRDRKAILDAWESLFSHHSFTGRSSRFFAFEGLGSIYWHMISKLLLAVQECALAENIPNIKNELMECYEDIRLGLGFTKTADVYGAFPTDAYSHSPRHIGAQQPGMTGQVKEEILTRRVELGITIKNGCIKFIPEMIQSREFSKESTSFDFYTLEGSWKKLPISVSSFACTFCQTPIIYEQSDKFQISILRSNGSQEIRKTESLSKEDSQSIFARTGEIKQITLSIPRKISHQTDVYKDELKLESTI